MSFSAEEKVTCACGNEFVARVWSSVHVGEGEDLKEAILSGCFNVVECTECHKYVYAERFVLYHDPSTELMAFVYPQAYKKERVSWGRKTLENFQEAQKALPEKERIDYPPVTIFGLDALVDLLGAEDEMRDQASIFISLAPSLGLEIFPLRASLARKRGVPIQMPLSKGKAPMEERAMEGLSQLVKANDQLTVYADLLKRLEEESSAGVFE